MKYFYQLLFILFLSTAQRSFMNQQTILVTGGAGYIGSHTAYELSQNNYNVIVLDDFVYNQPFNHTWAQVIKGSLADEQLLTTIFTNNKIDAVMHFAASIEVGLSVKDPASFYQNNVVNTLKLLDAMRKHNVHRIIFSSSCAVYGIPQHIPLTESHPHKPISPYGATKSMIEQILHDYHNAYGLHYVCLRYFNASGAHPEMQLGERHEPETHVIPLLLRAGIHGTEFSIFGTDYSTIDGTAERDYVHVRDIANAHVKALHYLESGNDSDCFNLGTGAGISVQTMINECEKIIGKSINIIHKPRREGDPAQLIADPSKANNLLGWKPHHSNINNILATAYEFEQFKLNKKP